MAEEESGFTFVDKRRPQAEDTPVAPAEAPPAGSADVQGDPEVDDLYMDDPEGGDQRPDIYGILGYCISLLSAEAWQKMGLLADPQTGQSQPDLDQAKVAIDAVGDLAARLEGAPADAVPDSLRRDLRTLLNDLRLNYVAQRGPSPGP